ATPARARRPHRGLLTGGARRPPPVPPARRCSSCRQRLLVGELRDDLRAVAGEPEDQPYDALVRGRPEFGQRRLVDPEQPQQGLGVELLHSLATYPRQAPPQTPCRALAATFRVVL